MTFDSATLQTPLAEKSLLQNESYAEIIHNTTRKTITLTQETSHEFCEDNQISNWEDEGGTYFDSPSAVHRDSGLRNISYITEHIEAAETLIDAGEYEATYTKFEAVADRLIGYKEKISQSFDNSIVYLSTLGCRATLPHPVALQLVRLRRKLTA